MNPQLDDGDSIIKQASSSPHPAPEHSPAGLWPQPAPISYMKSLLYVHQTPFEHAFWAPGLIYAGNLSPFSAAGLDRQSHHRSCILCDLVWLIHVRARYLGGRASFPTGTVPALVHRPSYSDSKNWFTFGNFFLARPIVAQETKLNS